MYLYKSRVFPDWRKFVDSEDSKQAFFRFEIVKKMPKDCLTVCGSLFTRLRIVWQYAAACSPEIIMKLHVLFIEVVYQANKVRCHSFECCLFLRIYNLILFFILLYKSVNRARAPEIIRSSCSTSDPCRTTVKLLPVMNIAEILLIWCHSTINMTR